IESSRRERSGDLGGDEEPCPFPFGDLVVLGRYLGKGEPYRELVSALGFPEHTDPAGVREALSSTSLRELCGCVVGQLQHEVLLRSLRTTSLPVLCAARTARAAPDRKELRNQPSDVCATDRHLGSTCTTTR